MMSGPNPLGVAWSMVRVLARVKRPDSIGQSAPPDYSGLAPILAVLANSGAAALRGVSGELDRFLADLAKVEPDELARADALAFWLNAYNAGALRLVAAASTSDQTSVRRVPGGFRRPFLTVHGERLSLDAVEHAKIRRFGDPRIHGALVCGSVSCPTLRSAPYEGHGLDDQLANQMRVFLASGGAVLDGSRLRLSRVFLWYGADFVRPQRMPAFLPVRRATLARSLLPWLPVEAANAVTTGAQVEFQPYDWGLRCAVR